MSWEATEWARKQRVGDSALKLVLITLGNYANEDAESWYGMARICHDTEIPERTLRRKLEALVKKNLIEIEPRIRSDGTKASNLIRLLIHPPATVAGGQQRTPADTIHRPKQAVATGQKGGAPSATWVAGQDSLRIDKEKHLTCAQDDSMEGFESEPDFGEIFEVRVMPEYPKRQGGRDAPGGRKKFVALCKTGTDPESLIDAVKRYRIFCDATGKTGTEFVMQVPRFFNSGGHNEPWNLPPTTPRPGGKRPGFNEIADRIRNR